jgi:hypothetical protein
VSKIRAVSGFASEKAAGGDYEAALKGLDALEKLLEVAVPQAPTPPPQPKQQATPDKAVLEKELAALARRIPELPPTTGAMIKARLVKLATDANVNIKTNNLNYAANYIAQLREALRDALDAAGVGVGQVVAPRRADGAPAPLEGMAGWQAARGVALASLKVLEGAFRKMKEPETDRAIILLRAIQANLTEAPTTPAQVTELENYLTTDRIIQEAEMPNGFGFKVALREPLLAALARLRREQDAIGEQPR